MEESFLKARINELTDERVIKVTNDRVNHLFWRTVSGVVIANAAIVIAFIFWLNGTFKSDVSTTVANSIKTQVSAEVKNDTLSLAADAEAKINEVEEIGEAAELRIAEIGGQIQWQQKNMTDSLQEMKDLLSEVRDQYSTAEALLRDHQQVDKLVTAYNTLGEKGLFEFQEKLDQIEERLIEPTILVEQYCLKNKNLSRTNAGEFKELLTTKVFDATERPVRVELGSANNEKPSVLRLFGNSDLQLRIVRISSDAAGICKKRLLALPLSSFER